MIYILHNVHLFYNLYVRILIYFIVKYS